MKICKCCATENKTINQVPHFKQTDFHVQQQPAITTGGYKYTDFRIQQNAITTDGDKQTDFRIKQYAITTGGAQQTVFLYNKIIKCNNNRRRKID